MACVNKGETYYSEYNFDESNSLKQPGLIAKIILGYKLRLKKITNSTDCFQVEIDLGKLRTSKG